MTFFYLLLAFIVGLLLGWFLWGRQRNELNDLRVSLDRARGENNRLRTDTTRLADQLEACGGARADLERQLQEARALSVPANVVAFPSASTATKRSSTLSAAKSAVKAKATKPSARRSKVAKPAAGKDNLRRLIGIGPVNERKLNEHGITTFAQIASWKAADIRSVEEYLEFDGRIKRERWVQQAKLLAAGKEGEFVRRFPTARSSNNT